VSELIIFTVPAVPVPQPRQRHRVIHANGRAFAHNYTPAKDPVNAFKAAVQLASSQAYQGPPLEGPLDVSLIFVFPRPQRLVWKKRPMPRVWHTSVPDRDNLMKSFQDALNKLIWVDDGQICDGVTLKYIAAGNEQPHVEVVIRQIGDDEVESDDEPSDLPLLEEGDA
jgi:Holliday junction resolvase RusA-like endonuclease